MNTVLSLPSTSNVIVDFYIFSGNYDYIIVDQNIGNI